MFAMKPNTRELVEDIQLAPDGSNAELFIFPVDPITSKSCSKNYGGFIRNDIQLIVEQTDETVAAELLLRLQERASDGISDQTMSDSDLLLSYKSKYCQTNSEMIAYYDRLLAQRDEKALTAKDEEDKKLSEAEKHRLRDALWNSMTAAEKDQYLADKRKREIEEGLKDD